MARVLGIPLDVLIAHKLGAPGEPELAIGAIASDGTTVLDAALIGELDIPAGYVEREREAQLREIERRLAVYRRGRPAVPIAGRCAILCDDGIATGATALAALRALRRQNPGRLILAVPVAPRAALDKLSRECDEAAALAVPDPFIAVGRFFWEFGQTTDEQVIAALHAGSFDTPNQA
jgi:predicted phosphoribosyltransferase